MKLFEIVNNQPVLTPEILLIPQFKLLWDRDKDTNKDNAKNELAYIYFLLDFQSPYLAYNEDEREEIITQDLFKTKNYNPDKDIVAAMQKYQEFTETPATNLLKGVRVGLDKVRRFLIDVDLDERTKAGTAVHKPGDITKAMSDADKMVESYNKLVEKARTEQAYSEKLRGGVSGGLREFDDD